MHYKRSSNQVDNNCLATSVYISALQLLNESEANIIIIDINFNVDHVDPDIGNIAARGAVGSWLRSGHRVANLGVSSGISI